MKKSCVAAAVLVLLVVRGVVLSQNKPSTSTINLTSAARDAPASPTAGASVSAIGTVESSSTGGHSGAGGPVVAAAKSGTGAATSAATTTVAAAPIHIANPSDNVTTTTVLAGSSRQPQSSGTEPNGTHGGGEPVAQPSAALDADASAQFGVRYAGLSYDLSTPRVPTIHVKVGGPTPSTFEGVAVVSAQYSLQELQQYLDHLDSLQTVVMAKVPMVGYGLDIANNAVMVDVSSLSYQVQADFTSLVGSGPYALHLQLGQNVLGTGPPGSVPKP